MDLPYLKTISQIFYQLQNSRYIADIQGFEDPIKRSIFITRSISANQSQSIIKLLTRL